MIRNMLRDDQLAILAIFSLSAFKQSSKLSKDSFFSLSPESMEEGMGIQKII